MKEKKLKTYNVKESVFPFNKFDGVDLILGPEMKSTGEVMGIDDNFLSAFIKSQIASLVQSCLHLEKFFYQSIMIIKKNI